MGASRGAKEDDLVRDGAAVVLVASMITTQSYWKSRCLLDGHSECQVKKRLALAKHRG